MLIHIDSNYPFDGYMESKIGGRSENQDTCGSSDTPHGLLIVVCDGMGGGPAGKTASLIATQTIIDAIKSSEISKDKRDILKNAISDANKAIRDAVKENPSLTGMGTTTVTLLLGDDCAYVGHVGDSRLYKLRGREKIFRTKDHSYVGDLVRRGQLTEEQARLSAQSNIITKALGSQDICEPEIDVIAYEKGDRFALCSDGIWGAFPEPLLIKKMSENGALDSVVDRLATDTDEQGRANGSHHDNLTIAIIETKTDSKKKDSMTRLAKRIILLMALLIVVCLGGIAYLYNSQSQVSKLKNELIALNDKVQDRDSTIAKLQQDIKKIENEKVLADEKVKTAQAKEQTANAKAEAADARAEAANAKAEGAEKRAQEAEAKAKTVDKQPKTKKGKDSSVQSNAVELLKKKLKELAELTAPKSKSLDDKFKNSRDEIIRIIDSMGSNKYNYIKDYLQKHRFDTKFRGVKGGVGIGIEEQKKINEFINNL